MNNFVINGTEFRADLDHPIDISIPLQFNGLQPNAYGVESARSEPCKAGEIVGDTRRGGSVNFEQYTFIPHCNGTHTECVGHITHERISVRDCLRDVLIPAILISVEPSPLDQEARSETTDRVITRNAVKTAVDQLGSNLKSEALIIRTLPNDHSKLERRYGDPNSPSPEIPPYFSADAMRYLIELGVKHLLVDTPSIDRIFDDGKLVNHRIFWNVEEGSFETGPTTRLNSTITELIYVPNDVADGEYLLNLQIAPFVADASPSRPLLLKITKPVI